MSDRPGRAAVAAALADWRRHAAAILVIALGFGLAAIDGSSVAYFAAWLVAFSVWMLWFILTTIEWVRHAEF